ncbi:MAG: hypothetical protein IPL79_10430 [Myxococcales bacterium]|nr:hypothetical protein [Myxococcales bacterium]
MTLADLVSELGSQMKLRVHRNDSVELLRQAGIGVSRDARGAARLGQAQASAPAAPRRGAAR